MKRNGFGFTEGWKIPDSRSVNSFDKIFSEKTRIRAIREAEELREAPVLDEPFEDARIFECGIGLEAPTLSNVDSARLGMIHCFMSKIFYLLFVLALTCSYVFNCIVQGCCRESPT